MMMSRLVRVVAGAGLVLGVVFGAAVAAGVSPAEARADAKRAGDAVIVEGSDRGRPLEHGASASVFALRLPDDARCPGDSAHDDWRVQSFMVPAAVDPGSLQYLLRQPKLDGGFPLFQVNGSAFVQQGTAVNDEPGKEAKLGALPTFNFAKFTPGLVPAGTYRIGLACTKDRITERYWDAEVIITESSNDRPAGFVWRTPSAPADINRLDEPSNTGTYVAVAALVVLALGAGVVVVRRRAQRSAAASPSTPRATTSSKE